MKPLIFLSLIWCQLTWAIDSQPLNRNQSVEYPVIIRVYFQNQQQLQILDAFSDLWSVNQQQKFTTIYIPNQSTYQKLHNMDLPMYIDQKLMVQLQNHQQNTSQSKNFKGTGIPGYACYSTVEETFDRMDQMELNHPTLAKVFDIGDSWEKTINGTEGHDIRILKLTNQSIAGDKPILFLASAIHAREYATAELNTRFAEYLLSEYGQNPDVTWILDNHEIHLSLQTNPDGRKQAETGELWRKNTNQDYCTSNTNLRGADLNRNYSYQWGGEPNECDTTYGGSSAESEPELQAQMTYIRSIFADNRGPGDNAVVDDDTAGIFVDIHSHSRLVLYPWGYTGINSPNDHQFQALSKRTAWFNDYLPEAASDLYPVSGASIDTTYGELGIASLVFEIGTEFFQKCDVFEATILPENTAALMYLARVTSAPYKQPLGPDIENLIIAPNVITPGTNILIFGTANDDRYSLNNGPQSTETVQSISVYTNELPVNASSGTALPAKDGFYDQVQEDFNSQLATSTLTAGKNLLYVQASDGTHVGGTYAKFVDVINLSEVTQLSGQVTDAYTGEAISGSLLQINQSNALSQTNGYYSQNVLPGQADLVASANNYLNTTIPNLELIVGQQMIQNVQLQPICEIFNQDFENGIQNWLAQSPWAISNELSVSPSHAWSDSPGEDYGNNRNVALTSPAITINQANWIEVSYMSHCDTEAGYDYGHFEVRFDAGPWQEISQCDNQSSWRQEVQNIDVPDGAAELKMRFRLTTDTSLTRDGWHIDDIKIKATGPICAGLFDDSIFINGFESISSQ